MTVIFNCYLFRLCFLIPALFLFYGSAHCATWSIEAEPGAKHPSIVPGSSVTIKGSKEFDEWFTEHTQDQKKVFVYTNGQLLEQSVLRLRNAQTHLYVFEFNRSAISATTWPAIRSRSPDSPYFSRNIDLAFGDETSIYWDAGIQTVQLVLIQTKILLLWFLVILALLLLFLSLAKNSNILRSGEPPAPGHKPPMSLASTQMAFWLFIIISTYIWIWLISGNLQSTNETVLILLGIASGTYLGAVFIEGTSQLTQTAKNTASKAANPLSPALQTNRIRKRETTWFMQLLSDNTGVKLHRFQILAWTLVLGVIFVTETIKTLGMPTFPPSLLGLMGISTSTYLGFKFPELRGQDQIQPTDTADEKTAAPD